MLVSPPGINMEVQELSFKNTRTTSGTMDLGRRPTMISEKTFSLHPREEGIPTDFLIKETRDLLIRILSSPLILSRVDCVLEDLWRHVSACVQVRFNL